MTDKELINQLQQENNTLRSRIKELQRIVQLSGGTPEQKQASGDKNRARAEKRKAKKEKKSKQGLEWSKRYDHPLWRKRRLQILERDNHTCSECSSRDNLHVHHIIYEKGFNVWEYEACYLQTLCATCHENAHKSRDIKTFINTGKPIKRWVMR